MVGGNDQYRRDLAGYNCEKSLHDTAQNRRLVGLSSFGTNATCHNADPGLEFTEVHQSLDLKIRRISRKDIAATIK